MAKISKDQLVHLQSKLKTDQAIAGRYGITRQAVHQWRKEYGIESSAAKNPERDKEIRKLHDAGTSVAALCKKYNLSSSQAYRIINRTTKKKPSKK